ncbi:MAG: DUF393 domain-containing protein [Actinomycetales bacterium]|nr:DUF393 domain-containing protein [Actinomycetales bacterium]
MGELVFLVYDGDCGFCQRCADWYRARVGPEVLVVSGADFLVQSNRLSPAEVASSVWWVESGAARHGAAAVACALAATKTPWRVVGRLATRGPVSRFLEPLYQTVARYRHRLPGGHACRDAPASRAGGSRRAR